MENERIDSYDMLLELLGYPHGGSDGSSSMKVSKLTRVFLLADELGISLSGVPLDLMLWNDDVHDMMEIALALYEICKLDNEDALRVMMEAHNTGKALIRTGGKDELMGMMNMLGNQGIQVSLHVSKEGES